MKNLTIVLSNGLLAFATIACSAQAGVTTPGHDSNADQVSSAKRQHAGKVTAPVTVELVSSDKTGKKATLPLMLRFKTDRPNVPLRVEYRADAGLFIVTASNAALVSGQDGVATDTPNVRAAVDGVYHLNVFVTVDDRTRAVSIPVIVGNAKQVRKSAGKAMQTPQGESLMILPAQESTH
ncbi:putative lipoprotein [Collimonas arenae]|uniref:Putative lipoprotein n=1 Tax=Collimonas arenae TaxID=279058 RepID=A0A127QIJ8_9BURK|nr:hypothetical protein [Collimonas arenae]AMO99938.1 putative lipoprotein [Collimonas arenae]AMP09834.1 putative lipoprotein [Collimonas arenae]